MRIRNIFPDFKDEGDMIATWGGAELIKHWDGRLELRAGSKEDREEARVLLSLFWHGAVVREVW